MRHAPCAARRRHNVDFSSWACAVLCVYIFYHTSHMNVCVYVCVCASVNANDPRTVTGRMLGRQVSIVLIDDRLWVSLSLSLDWVSRLGLSSRGLGYKSSPWLKPRLGTFDA